MKTPIAINIGLNTTHGTRLDVHTATFQASRLGQIVASRVTDSPAGSEQTLALSILASGTRETFDAALYFIAQSLSQDCISCYDGADGKLIGPNAEAWGAFEPAFFINPATGRTLADETPRLDIGSLPHQYAEEATDRAERAKIVLAGIISYLENDIENADPQTVLRIANEYFEKR